MADAVRAARSKYGVGLFARRELRAGEAALRERPLLFVVCGGRRRTVCAVCGEQGSRVRWACAGGCGAHYCSRACLEADGHGAHAARLCRRLGRAPSACKAAGVTHPDGADAVRWALHALWLRESSPDRWHALRRLEPRDEDPLPERAHEVLAVHTECGPRSADKLIDAISLAYADEREGEGARLIGSSEAVAHAPPLPLLRHQTLLRLLLRDALNSTCLTVDPTKFGGSPTDAAMREPAVVCTYATLCLANHDCAPTCARVDSRPAMRYGEVELRCMMNVPAGAEVTMSYLPMGATRHERRERLLSTHAFECACERCQCEAAEERDGEGTTEHASYFSLVQLRHVCPSCEGTLYPQPRARKGETRYVCNNWPCNYSRSEQEFFELLEDAFGDGGGGDESE